jgi:AcrR family transcriptional regulator
VSIAESSSLTRRERQRAATVEEIKEVARVLMREHGASEVRFTDIARVMGMTPPALYRYYDDRDALLTDLIADGYRDLGRAVAEARERVDADDVAGSWPDTPILGFTNHTDTRGLQRAHAAGFDQVIVKSALVDRARQVVDELVGVDA